MNYVVERPFLSLFQNRIKFYWRWAWLKRSWVREKQEGDWNFPHGHMTFGPIYVIYLFP